ncbi:S-layer family protein [Microbulbifer sp. 2205BS26-8]|uniref:beta strand repeat-containing protein n=2 Tax=Microbulbifer sp. 2205BS26-8 TaxID=3064386 RepID=UPI00273D8ACC|nr:Ig-like domain-containing protein [Microbulbifer sp. 2205BS26-8]MDP5211004.1 Ig-like domain-containing protein [Microbulbifer sp. 2205BS26-8]
MTLRLFWIILLSAVLAGCDSDSNNNNNQIPRLVSISIFPAGNLSLAPGETQQYTARANYSNGTTSNITNSVNWQSEDSSVATVSGSGVATAVAPGSTRIFASFAGIVSNRAPITVSGAVLTSIQVTPAVVSLPMGNSQQLTALGIFSDGSTTDITNSVTWFSDNTAIATVDSLGEVMAVAVGSTSVSASQDGIVSNTVSVTVTAALTSIQVTPAVVRLPTGYSQQLTALGFFSDGSTADITNSVTWFSDNTAIATVDSLGELMAVAVGSTIVSASQGGIVSNTVSVTVTNAVLTSIQVTPAVVNLPAGYSQQLTAQGNFSDGSTLDITTSVNWDSDNTAIATVDSLGEVMAVAAGGTIVSANRDGIDSNMVSVTVTNAVLTSIQVTPAVVNLPAGYSQQLTALGIFSDGSTRDITTSVTWLSDNTAIATVDSLGELMAVAVGSTSVSANRDGIDSNMVSVTVTNAVLTSIQVTPAVVNLPAGYSQQLTALGNFSDGSTRDITTSVTWISDNTAIATVDSLGELVTVAAGSTSVSANRDGIVSNMVSVTVTNAVLTAIRTLPVLDLPAGYSQQIRVLGDFSDGSTLDITTNVTWISNDASIATVDSLGVVMAWAAGSTSLTANRDGIVSNMLSVTVNNAVLIRIDTPLAVSLPAGYSNQFTVLGGFSDGSTLDITTSVNWFSDNTAIATIATVDSLGELMAVAVGSASVSASRDGLSSIFPVTVTNAVLTSIQVTPAVVNLPAGNSQQLTAQGSFSDGSTADITDNVNWFSGDTAIATVDSLGEVVTVAVGSTSVSANRDGIVSNTVPVTVTTVLTSIQVTPAVVNLPAGNSQQLTAQGIFSDGSTADITDNVNWFSGDTAIATVDSLGEVVAVGSTSLVAIQGSILSNGVFVNANLIHKWRREAVSKQKRTEQKFVSIPLPAPGELYLGQAMTG